MTNNSELTPPFGDFQDIDGRKVYVHSEGSGGPAVVFLPGASAIGLDYYGIHAEVARFTTSVIYDRGGSGYSDVMPVPRTAEDVAVELRELLKARGIEGPYILVPHSLGGAYAHRFAQLFPEDVAGVVWLDAFHHDWDDYVSAGNSLAASMEMAPTEEQLRQALPFMREFVEGAFADLPQDVRDALVEYHLSDTWIRVGIAERSSVTALADELKAGPAMPAGVPLIAVTPLGVDPNQAALMSEEQLQEMHDGKRRQYDDLAASVGGENRVLTDTDHSRLCFDRPDVIVQAVRDVIDRANAR